MACSQPSQGQHDPCTWFTQSQLQTVIRNNIVPKWFHGIISRKTAEDLLMQKPQGYFLIRVSESRVGYTLTYRADDRCRHFMIDVLEDGDYIIVGENRRHRLLQDLVDFHCRNPILPFTELLTVACGQSSNDQTDYAELLFPQRHRKPDPSLQCSNSRQLNVSPQESPEESLPPALPTRPNDLWKAEVLVPSSQPDFHYSSLHFPHTTGQLPDMSHTDETHIYELPSLVPGQSCVPVPVLEGPTSPIAPQYAPNRNNDVKPPVSYNLKNLKKKFQKKTNKPQGHLYMEATHRNQHLGEQAFNGAMVTDRALPPEYLPPPPYAPGF